MKTNETYPFTAAQFNALPQEQRQAVLAVAEHLTSSAIAITDEALSTSLNLMREAEGCVPPEYLGEDLLPMVRRKFAAIYETAMELAEAELKQRGLKERKHFNFCLVIEPSYEDATHVAIVDYERPICYLHQWSKAWHLGFATLAELAGEVVAAKTAIVNKVEQLNAKEIAATIKVLGCAGTT